MISNEDLQQAWQKMLDSFDGRPRLQICLKEAELFLSDDGTISFTVDDFKERELLKESLLSLIQERLETALNTKGIILRVTSKDVLNDLRNRALYESEKKEEMAYLWEEWEKKKTLFQNKRKLGQIDEKTAYEQHEIEDHLVSELASFLKLSIDERYSLFRTPFYVTLLHDPKKANVEIGKICPSITDDYFKIDWTKSFRDPYDAESTLDELYSFAEDELRDAIADGVDRLIVFLNQISRKYLGETGQDSKFSFFDFLVNRCYLEKWSEQNQWGDFDAFILKSLPEETEKITSFLNCLYSERIGTLCFFSKQTGNEFKDMTKVGFINSIRQAFVERIQDQTNAIYEEEVETNN